MLAHQAGSIAGAPARPMQPRRTNMRTDARGIRHDQQPAAEAGSTRALHREVSCEFPVSPTGCREPTGRRCVSSAGCSVCWSLARAHGLVRRSSKEHPATLLCKAKQGLEEKKSEHLKIWKKLSRRACHALQLGLLFVGSSLRSSQQSRKEHQDTQLLGRLRNAAA